MENKKLSTRQEIFKYRQEAREKVYEEISQQIEEKKDKGLYPFESKWRTLEEITGLKQLLQKKDRAIFTDLLILCIIIIFLNVFIMAVLYSI